MGGAYIAHFAMYATLEDRTHGKNRPCGAPPQINFSTYFVDTTLFKGQKRRWMIPYAG